MKFFTFVSAALATLAVASAMSVDIQAAGNGITPLQSLGAKMSKLSNEVQAAASGYGVKENGLGRRDGDLLTNLLEPLLGNLENTIAALLGYGSLKPVGHLLASMHSIVKALPSLNVTEGTKAMSSAADAADDEITLLQSLIDQMSKLNNEIQAMGSDNGAKENGLGRRADDLLTNLLEPLLGNLLDTIAKLLGYPSLTPVGRILANMHTIVKALPSLAGGGSLGLGGNQTGATRT
ncbi:hypothetical protein K438DRAFT_1960904 [Mycena galopus ATCC 62051]|nr:hypothetical protein K438DRAFT_1960904 [Mycena galopus ATCC 62051]